jgi:hypothetical protein
MAVGIRRPGLGRLTRSPKADLPGDVLNRAEKVLEKLRQGGSAGGSE